MRTTKKSNSASAEVTVRDRIIDAAVEVVLRKGAGSLTLDAAAAEAGLSKGGILYHFRTKAALIEALVERLVNGCEAKHVSAAAAIGQRNGMWTQAFLTASLAGQRDPSRQFARLSGALLAAIAYDPKLLEPLKALYRTWQERLENDGIPQGTAHLVRLAMDGIWLAEILDLPLPSIEIQQEIEGTLLRILREASTEQLMPKVKVTKKEKGKGK